MKKTGKRTYARVQHEQL